MLSLITFVHLTCGVLFFGFTVGTLVIVLFGLQKNNLLHLSSALKMMLIADVLLFPVILMLFFTAGLMVAQHDLSIHTPWIFVAYVSLSLIGMLWATNIYLKRKALTCLREKKSIFSAFKPIFIVNTSLMIFIFIVIVHDAVMQNTVFSFLF